MAQLHTEEDEPVCEHPFDYSFEDENLHRIRLQELIWEEVGDFRPPRTKFFIEVHIIYPSKENLLINPVSSLY